MILAKFHVISGFIEKIIVGVFQNPFFQNSGLVSMSPIWGGIQKKVSKVIKNSLEKQTNNIVTAICCYIQNC